MRRDGNRSIRYQLGCHRGHHRKVQVDANAHDLPFNMERYRVAEDLLDLNGLIRLLI